MRSTFTTTDDYRRAAPCSPLGKTPWNTDEVDVRPVGSAHGSRRRSPSAIASCSVSGFVLVALSPSQRVGPHMTRGKQRRR